jgi:glyoxylase-like metal-dependent hydrolase (beta-lactamase superfamily II)
MNSPNLLSEKFCVANYERASERFHIDMSSQPTLPKDIVVFERGWLSANNILLLSESAPALVDSGYVAHAPQTLALVEARLGAQGLSRLVNTHLHSDHCGGNAALQARYPDLVTQIPPGHAEQVSHWDTVALSYAPTGQRCDRFSFHSSIFPGSQVRLGNYDWEIHAAPGHDPHSILIFQPALSLLISADALWENGFGVVFPEIEGISAFDEVADTLELIEALQPQIVIPGHGTVFTDVQGALARARQRLHYFKSDPAKHAKHAAKVLIKFNLMDHQSISQEFLMNWLKEADYIPNVHRLYFKGVSFESWIEGLLSDLEKSGALKREAQQILNC